MTNLVPPPLPRHSAAIRLPLLDSLRGFALFGIFLINMFGYKVPLAAGWDTENYIPGRASEIAGSFVEILAASKFFPMFCFLFGMGLVLQQGRVLAAGRRFGPVHAGRMVIFLFLGIAHALLLWPGDILVIYSLFGFAALFFLRLKPRTLLVLAGLTLALLVIGHGALGSLTADFGDNLDWRSNADDWVDSYRRADVSGLIELRFAEWLWWWAMGVIYHIPLAFIFFLAGIAAGKTAPLARMDAVLPRAAKHLVWAIPAGIFLSSMTEWQDWGFLPDTPRSGLIGGVAGILAPLILAPAWFVGAAWMFSQGRFPELAAWLADAGRMSLSNYLLQSLVANAIFMNWGLGLYGGVSVVKGIVLTVLLFTLQLGFSRWWMKKFGNGPLEILVRKITRTG